MLIGLRDVGVLTLGRQSGWGAFCGHHAAADLRSRRLWVAGVPTQSPGATVPVFAVSAQVYRLTQYPAGRAVLLALVVSGLLGRGRAFWACPHDRPAARRGNCRSSTPLTVTATPFAVRRRAAGERGTSVASCGEDRQRLTRWIADRIRRPDPGQARRRDNDYLQL